MKRKSGLETATFDRALSDAFQGGPECGALGTVDDLSRRRMINDIILEASVTSGRGIVEERKNTEGHRTLMVGAVAAVIGVFMVASLIYGTVTSSRKTATPSPVEMYFGEVQENGGNLFFGDQSALRYAPIPVGKSIRTENGAAALRLPTGIDWRMTPHGHARIASLEPERLNIEVLAGESWFRVDPNREGPSFSVDTKMGRIDVTGTIFLVEVGPSDVRLTLLEGEVWVTRATGRRNLVPAGHVMYLGNGLQRPIVAEEEKRLQARLAQMTWETDPAAVTVNVAPTLDDEPPPHGKTAFDIDPQAREMVAKLDFRQLHEEIQASRKKGDWGRVAVLYTRLIQSAPGSEAAIVSRVSLGEVCLTKLHQYKDALLHFEKYLRSGHTALLPEAFYGKCSALKALGKRDREMACLDRFVQRFASAFQASDARARLDALRSDGHR